jgi:hypothetical protein
MTAGRAAIPIPGDTLPATQLASRHLCRVWRAGVHLLGAAGETNLGVGAAGEREMNVYHFVMSMWVVAGVLFVLLVSYLHREERELQAERAAKPTEPASTSR